MASESVLNYGSKLNKPVFRHVNRDEAALDPDGFTDVDDLDSPTALARVEEDGVAITEGDPVKVYIGEV